MTSTTHDRLHGRCFEAIQARGIDPNISHRESDAYTGLYPLVYDALHSTRCTRQQLLDTITTSASAEALRTQLQAWVPTT
jgi:hypothetical protein